MENRGKTGFYESRILLDNEGKSRILTSIVFPMASRLKNANFVG